MAKEFNVEKMSLFSRGGAPPGAGGAAGAGVLRGPASQSPAEAEEKRREEGVPPPMTIQEAMGPPAARTLFAEFAERTLFPEFAPQAARLRAPCLKVVTLSPDFGHRKLR